MSILVGSGRYAALDIGEPEGNEDLATVRLASGGLAIAWISGGVLIGYVVDANGNGGSVQVLGPAFDKPYGDLYDVSLAALPSGGIAAAWIDLDGNINTRAFDATLSPTGDTQTVSAGGVPGSIGQPSLAALTGGGFVMAYAVANDGSGEGIRAQIFGSTGTPVGSSFAVNTATAGNQELPIATGLANGGFLLSWADAGGQAYAGQFYNAAGQAVGGQVSLAPGGNGIYDIAALASGSFVIVWPGADGELRGQVYTAAGIKVGAEFQLNTPTAAAELMPDVTALDSGGFALAWVSPSSLGGSEIHAQVFSPNGTPGGTEIIVSDAGGGTAFPRITGYGTDDLTISWIRFDEDLNTVMMSRSLYSAVSGTNGADVIGGTSGRDFYFGFAGDDQLSGANANDELHGDDGNDILNGGAGLDTIDGGAGNDVIDTGPGSSESAFDLYSGDIAWGGSGADQITAGDGWDKLYSDQREDPEGYFSFDIRVPQGYRAPTLDHGTEVDTISAGGGDDFVSIGYGDSADGGSQSPGNMGDRLTVSFFAAPSGVTADFRNPTITVGGGTITGFEQIDYIEGSQFNDVFTFAAYATDGPSAWEISTLGGDDQVIAGFYTSNVWGGDGNDIIDASASQYVRYISGGAGNDRITGTTRVGSGATLDGGDGDDVIKGGLTDETLIGGAGNDTLDGGAGTDLADFSTAATGVNVALATTGPQNTNQGIDTFANIENLWGSAFADTLGGTAGSNDIRGGAGDDWLYGGAGGNDQLFGEDGNDTLDGRGGAAAQLYGGNGNDTYYVDGNDTISEVINSFPNPTFGTGIDQVYSSATFTLGNGLENLTLTGTAAIDGTGNSSNNIIIGNVAANVLKGSFGNDTLTGGLGADTLTGGSGADTFQDTAAGLNGDTITDFSKGDRIVISDATMSQSLGWSNGQLTLGSTAIALTNLNNASIVASAAPEGGVQISYGGPPLILAAGASVSPAMVTGAPSQQTGDWKPQMLANYEYSPAPDHPAAAGHALISLAEGYRAFDLF